MEGFQRWTSPWLFAPLSCLIYLFVCVCVQADSSEGDNSPENYSERPSCFWISSQEFINKHNSGTRPPTALRNISMKRLIALRSLPPPSSLESSAYEEGILEFSIHSEWMPKWVTLAYLICRGGEVCLIRPNIWMIAIHSDSNYEARTHPQKHPYTFQLAAEMLNCKAQTNTKNYSNCAQLGDIFALLSLWFYGWLAACSGKQSPASTSKVQTVQVRSAAPNLAVDFNENLWELCLYKHVGLIIIWIQYLTASWRLPSPCAPANG